MWMSRRRQTGVRVSGAVRQEKVAEKALTCAIPESIAARIKAFFHEMPPLEVSNAANTSAKKIQPAQNIRWWVFTASDLWLAGLNS
jgi:hypothetical protein